MGDSDGRSLEAGAPAAVAGPRFSQAGQHRELLPIVLRNVLLGLITLTIYRFWGRTNVRRYLWRTTRFMDEPLEYTGVGMELFLGFVFILFVVIVPLLFLTQGLPLLLAPDHPAVFGAGLIAYLAILCLIGMAIYRARRYRLSRTLWRGIRGTMQGSSVRYGLIYLGLMLLNVFSIGLAYPFTRARLLSRLMRETAVGDQTFACRLPARRLYGPFFGALTIAALLLVPVGALASSVAVVVGSQFGWALENLGEASPGLVQLLPVVLLAVGYAVLAFAATIPLAFYKTREYARLADATAFRELTFAFRASTPETIGLFMGNLLLILLTLGLAMPFVQLRNFRFFCRHLAVAGSLDPATIHQSAATAPRVGEGLAEAFDMGSV